MFEIKTGFEDGRLTAALKGRLDSATAPEAQKAFDGALAGKEAVSAVCDAAELEYISSAGLRVMLGIKKKIPDFRIINVSSDVYEIFDMTGFSEIMDIEKAFRKFSVDGCAVIGEGAKGTVYRYDDDTIVKVYKQADSLPIIKRERELARKAFVLGVPTAISFDIVNVDGNYGSVFELLDAKSVSEEIAGHPEKTEEYVELFAGLLKQIHGTQVKESDMPDVKIMVNKWAEACVPYLTEEQNAKIRRLIDETPDTMNMLHCDYHTNNIMMQDGEAILIDMDTLSHGHPIFELANIFITYVAFGEVDETVVEKFIGLPYAKAVEIWNMFLPVYLGEKADRREEIEDKIKLLSYLRLMRHVVRRGINSENDRKTVELCREKISGLIDRVDSLDF